MDRRSILTGLSTITVPISSGCIDLFDSSRLMGIIGVNYSEGEENIEVRVIKDEAEVERFIFVLERGKHENRKKIGKETFAPCEWPTSSGDFEIQARIADEERNWNTINVSGNTDSDCAVVVISFEIRFQNRVVSLDSHECSDIESVEDLPCE